MPDRTDPPADLETRLAQIEATPQFATIAAKSAPRSRERQWRALGGFFVIVGVGMAILPMFAPRPIDPGLVILVSVFGVVFVAVGAMMWRLQTQRMQAPATTSAAFVGERTEIVIYGRYPHSEYRLELRLRDRTISVLDRRHLRAARPGTFGIAQFTDTELLSFAPSA